MLYARFTECGEHFWKLQTSTGRLAAARHELVASSSDAKRCEMSRAVATSIRKNACFRLWQTFISKDKVVTVNRGFRPLRVTHLESSCVLPALVKYWTGQAKSSDGEIVRQTMTDRYIKMAKDTKFRADVAERIGLGFDLPKAKTVEVVPGVPKVPGFQSL